MGTVIHKIEETKVVERIIDNPDYLRIYLKNANKYLEIHHTLPNRPSWNLILEKFDAHPHRFIHYHPEFKSILEKYNHLHKSPIHTSSIPEPSSWILLCIAIIIALILKRSG